MKLKAIIMTAVIFSFMACNWSGGQFKKRTTVEEYEQVLPTLSNREAKKAVIRQLEEQELDGKYYEDVRIGYYECNSKSEREKLYKLSVNDIIDFSCEEIMKTANDRTYWVRVELTKKGEKLLFKDNKKLYPEDKLTEEQLNQAVNRQTMINEYGELIFDTIVDESVRKMVVDFYKAYKDDKTYAIESYGTSDIIAASARINQYESYGGKVLSADPFTRGAEWNIDSCQVAKYNVYEDSYIVILGSEAFLFVIKDADGVKMLDDVLLSDPLKSRINVSNTFRSAAKNITKYQLAAAKQQKEMRERMSSLYGARSNSSNASARSTYSARSSYARANVSRSQEPETDDSFTQETKPGLVIIQREGETEYQKAKAQEKSETVRLYAYSVKVDCVDRISVQRGSNDEPVAEARLIMKVKDVNAVGRILSGKVEGEKITARIDFVRYSDKWEVD